MDIVKKPMLTNEQPQNANNIKNYDTFKKSYNCLLNVFCGLFENKEKTTISENLDEILLDCGSGPVSKGMIFLEIVSSCLRRGNIDSITSLKLPEDAPILVFAQPDKYESIDKQQAIIKSLGISGLAEIMKQTDGERYSIFIKAISDIYDRVAEGIFYRKNHRVLLPYLQNCTKKCKSTRVISDE